MACVLLPSVAAAEGFSSSASITAPSQAACGGDFVRCSHGNRPLSINWVRIITALLFGVYILGPDSWKLSNDYLYHFDMRKLQTIRGPSKNPK